MRGSEIGAGDRFLPSCRGLSKDVHVRFAEFPYRSHGRGTSLRSAKKLFITHKSNTRRSLTGNISPTIYHGGYGAEIRGVFTKKERIIKVYYCNIWKDTIHLEWCKPPFIEIEGNENAQSAQWSKIVIPPGAAFCLDVFFQDEMKLHSVWWKFRAGHGRDKLIGNALFVPHDFLHGDIQIRWHAYEPKNDPNVPPFYRERVK